MMKKVSIGILVLLVCCTPSAKYNNPTSGIGGFLLQAVRNVNEKLSSFSQKIVFTGLPSSVTEGQKIKFQVKMANPLDRSLKITMSSDNPAITIDGEASVEINFTPENSTTNQTFLLSAVSDSNAVSEVVNIKVSAPGFEDQTITVSTADTTPPPPVISISNIPTSITEGNTVPNVAIRLAGTVTDSYILVVSSSNLTAITSNPTALVFSPGNYSIDQPIALTALQDANLTDETVTFTLSSPGLDSVIFSVNTTDDDTQNISISGTTTLDEGGSGTLNISLTNEPAADVTVTLSSSVPSTLSLGTSTLTFTPANYNIPQAVTVSALFDANTLSENVTVTASASGITSKNWNVSTIEYPSGTITGLTSPLVLINNGTDTITVSANGTFTFNTPNVLYNVIAKTYSSHQICAVTGNTGNNSVTASNINVNCLGTYSDGEYALGLVKTGQTSVYFASDDGASQKTLSKTFFDNGDGTISDYATGLTWQKCSMGTNNDAACSGSPSLTTWAGANSYCANLNLGSRPIGSWKLASMKELATIVDLSKFGPSIDTTIFPNTGLFAYWSSSVFTPNTAGAWQLSFVEGYSNPWLKNSLLFARCVTDNTTVLLPTAIPPVSPSRFIDNANGTIKDKATGLTWQKCSYGQTPTTGPTACSSTGSSYYSYWVGANNYCNTLNLASKTWRLPNRNELHSILDYSQCYGANCTQINNTFFPYTMDRYWTSTTDAQNGGNAWIINFSAANSGTSEILTINKSSASAGNAGKIRCVSGP